MCCARASRIVPNGRSTYTVGASSGLSLPFSSIFQLGAQPHCMAVFLNPSTITTIQDRPRMRLTTTTFATVGGYLTALGLFSEFSLFRSLGTPWVSLIIGCLVLALFVVAVVVCRKYSRPCRQRTRASDAVQHPRPIQPEVVQSITISPPPAYNSGAPLQPPPYE
ncbi:hypothetical protein CPB85DRAFT_534163 [Mucidula mucida]|nr:hypothetical protein CPB85DRAFT_534163 [Mucidula mucida]